MAKKSIYLFLAFISSFHSCFGQENHTIIDTTWHENQQIETIYAFDTVLNAMSGFYTVYDSLGNVLIEGKYKPIDSTKCIACYDAGAIQFGTSHEKAQIHIANPIQIRIGTWNYYHPNGQVKMTGKYSKNVHSHTGSQDPSSVQVKNPILVYIDFDYLKEGEWHYFDEAGILLKTEWYVEGSLIHVLTFN